MAMGTSRDSSAPPILRFGHTLAFAAFLEGIGAPVNRHLRSQGLPDSCEDANAYVPLRQAWAFFDTCARHEDRFLGWHVGQFVGDRNLNAGLLRKLERAPTLFQALQGLIQLSRTEASHVQLGIRGRRDDAIIFTSYPLMKGVPGYASSQAYQLGLIVGLVRHFAGQNWMPDEIGIEDPIVPGVAKELFAGSRILARQPVGYLSIQRSCLHLASHSDDREVGGSDPFGQPERWGYVDTLRALLEAHLPGGGVSEALAASLMGTSVSTLKRRLSDAGTNYRAVVDQLRFNKAKELLEHTSEQIVNVAAAVGFDDPSHFTRMFRRVSGVSPREVRKNMRQVSMR